MMRGGSRKGAGRPPGPVKVSLKVHVLPETFRTLDLLAFAKCQTRGEVVDQLARRSVKKKAQWIQPTPVVVDKPEPPSRN
jgi:hypothetical protein